MKKNLLYILLIIEAAFCFAFNLIKASASDAFSAAMAFPFELIGNILRRISLTGKIGNCIALTLYAGLCILPVFFLIRSGSRRKLQAEDSLLGILSVALFAALYLMINPAYIGSMFGSIDEGGIEIGKAVLGGTLWSILIGYLILRVLRLSFNGGTVKLQGYAGALLSLLCFIFVWTVCGSLFGEMLNSFSALSAGNKGSESGLGMTYVFLVLRFLINALPYMLDLITVFFALDLLIAMRTDRYSEQTENIALHLSRWCGKALTAVVISGVSLNLLQLLFSRSLRNINTSMSIPIVSVLFVLAVLLFARLISENRKLKGDNDLFI